MKGDITSVVRNAREFITPAAVPYPHSLRMHSRDVSLEEYQYIE
jgi:hypothetical protein